MASGATMNPSDADRRETMINAKATTMVAEAEMTPLESITAVATKVLVVGRH